MNNLDDQLRAWAKGMYPTEAATELLIRTGRAHAGLPWVKRDDGQAWIDFAAIPDSIGAYSGGEQRVMRIAASLGSRTAVVLGDDVSGLDREHLDLVLAAIAHAGGSHEHSRLEIDGDQARIRRFDTLHGWPERQAHP